MLVVANRQLSGEYGHIAPGDIILMRDEVSKHLIERDLVTACIVVPENKSITPPDNKSAKGN
jgi:hypothetical protein